MFQLIECTVEVNLGQQVLSLGNTNRGYRINTGSKGKAIE